MVDALIINEITSFIATISSYKTKLDDKLEEGINLDIEYQNLKEKITRIESKNLKANYSLNEKGLMLYKK